MTIVLAYGWFGDMGLATIEILINGILGSAYLRTPYSGILK